MTKEEIDKLTEDLTAKVAIITGAASGMGKRQAEQFIKNGARVMLADIDPAVHEVSAALGEQALSSLLDVSEPGSWTTVVEKTLEAFGRVDVLVNTAGAPGSTPFLETTPEQFIRLFRINQLGPFLGMQAVVPTMMKQGKGSIINIGSAAALRASPGMVAYSSSKWAVRGLTKGVAVELARHGIRVNSIHPGVIDTPMLAGNTAEMNEQLLSKIPMGRLGTTDEIANVTVFLASDGASFMSGSDVTVDGAAYA